jgi:hypothetical protein
MASNYHHGSRRRPVLIYASPLAAPSVVAHDALPRPLVVPAHRRPALPTASPFGLVARVRRRVVFIVSDPFAAVAPESSASGGLDSSLGV